MRFSCGRAGRRNNRGSRKCCGIRIQVERARIQKRIEMQKNIRPIAIALTILSALGRLLPHPPNVTPVGSSSLFAGARVNGWMAYLLPILVMAVTDPLVGGYTRATPVIYL